jgi:SRSO17 transposase
LGKVDNCQVAVFSSLVRGSSSVLIDGRLYVPKDWTDDSDRCHDAGIPKGIIFKSKSQLALDSVRHLRDLGIRFSWVGIDGGYGKEPHFLSTLDDYGELFVAEVHKDQPFYLADPAPYIPERKSAKGRIPTLYKANGHQLRYKLWLQHNRKKLGDASLLAIQPREYFRLMFLLSEFGSGIKKKQLHAIGH